MGAEFQIPIRGFDDLLYTGDADVTGQWWLMRSGSAIPWSGWLEVCQGHCWGSTLPHLAVGNWDTDPADEIFSDVRVPTDQLWMYFDLGVEVGDWRPLGESGETFPDIVVGEWDGAPFSDVLRSSGGVWSLSTAATGSWLPVANTSVPADELVPVDIDGNGQDEAVHSASQW
jgi:hypothetical protein